MLELRQIVRADDSQADAVLALPHSRRAAGRLKVSASAPVRYDGGHGRTRWTRQQRSRCARLLSALAAISVSAAI